jgi:biotin carboxyl carrier protein
MTVDDRRSAADRRVDPGVRVSAPIDDAALDGRPIAVEPSDGVVLVDGLPTQVVLERLDPIRSVLIEAAAGGMRRTRVVLLDLPAGATPGVRRREALVDGWSVVVELESERRAALRERARRASLEAAAHGGPTEVRAIIPGRIVSVSVAPGDAVVAGQQLLVVEAMKMQNELRAPRDGTVDRVVVGAGGTIELGDLLLVLA